MRNLIVEIGNTALKAAWTEGLTLENTYRYQGEDMFSYVISLTEKERPATMVIASSIRIDADDEAVLANACDRLVVLDGRPSDVFIKRGVPGYISSDRAASLVAARHLFKGKGCLVFDFGTTVSIDILDSEGAYEGGNLSLGLRPRFFAMNRYSRNLPLLDVPETLRQTGNSVATSIESGVVSGIMFEIQGYLSLFPEKIVVFTGGDANYFAKRMKNAIFVICNLVLMGLALIADEYGN